MSLGPRNLLPFDFKTMFLFSYRRAHNNHEYLAPDSDIMETLYGLHNDRQKSEAL